MKKILILLISVLIATIGFDKSFFADEKIEYNVSYYDYFNTEIAVVNWTTLDSFNIHKENINTILDKYDKLTTNKVDHNIKGSIYDINRNAGKDVTVPKEVYDVLVYCEEKRNETNDYFDITIGTIIDIWKNEIAKNNRKEVDDSVLRSIQNAVIDELEKLPEDNRLTIYPPSDGIYKVKIKQGVKLDLGAITKGYAGKLIDDYFKGASERYYYANLGSSTLVFGENFDNKENGTFDVGLRDPLNSIMEFGSYGVVEGVKNVSLASSGNDIQFFTNKGETYHHIISPKSYSPINNYRVVTIFGEDAAMLDAYSTAMFSMGVNDATALVDNNNLQGIMYRKNGEIIDKTTTFNLVLNPDRKRIEDDVNYGRWIILGITILVVVTISVIGIYHVVISIKKEKSISNEDQEFKKNRIKRDIWMVSVIFFIILGIFVIYITTPRDNLDYVGIYYDKQKIAMIDYRSFNVEIYEISNNKDNAKIIHDADAQTLTIYLNYELEEKEEKMKIKYDFNHKSFEVIEADCVGQDCVHMGESTIFPVMCLPNKIIISFEGN